MSILLNSNITTKTSKSVQDAMQPYIGEAIDFNIKDKNNQKALKAYKDSIDKIYQSINASNDDSIILNSSVNESISQIFLTAYLKYILTGQRNSIIVSQRATVAELRVVAFLESQGCRIYRVPVTIDGTLDIDILKDYVNNKTALVSVALVDEESGVIQPIEEISKICSAVDAPLLVNAKDAMGRIGVDVQRHKVSYLTFSSDNIEGPKDISALYIAQNALELMPTVLGNDSEQGGIRESIKDIAKVIGFAKALEEAVDALDFEIEDIRELRDELEEGILKIDGAYSLAPWALRVPTVSIFAFRGVHASMLLDKLAQKEISAYSFSIFSNRNFQRVSLVEVANLDTTLRHCIVGFSLSSSTTKEEIDSAIEAIKVAIKEIRDASATCEEKR